MALSNRGQLRAELIDQGFDYLPTNRADYFLDFAATEIVEEAHWPFRAKEVTGNLPITITDLAAVENVTRGEGYVALAPRERQNLIDEFQSVTMGGAPQYYWIDGATTIRGFPSDTSSVTVRYYSSNAWTNGGQTALNDSDTPLIPLRYRELVVLLAKVRAKEDNDDYEEAGIVMQRYTQRLEQAKASLLKNQIDEEKIVKHVGDWA